MNSVRVTRHSILCQALSLSIACPTMDPQQTPTPPPPLFADLRHVAALAAAAVAIAAGDWLPPTVAALSALAARRANRIWPLAGRIATGRDRPAAARIDGPSGRWSMGF